MLDTGFYCIRCQFRKVCSVIAPNSIENVQEGVKPSVGKQTQSSKFTVSYHDCYFTRT